MIDVKFLHIKILFQNFVSCHDTPIDHFLLCEKHLKVCQNAC